MEDTDSPQLVLDGYVTSVKFSMSEAIENFTYSINNSSISHPSQLTNPFLGLPVESGMCESCGTSEQEKCEGHFGFIDLPIPVYHPCHVSEVKNILSWVCLKCLRMKKLKIKSTKGREVVSNASCPFCRDISISIEEVKKNDVTLCLELKVQSKAKIRDGFWNFLDKFGFHADNGTNCRPLLASEVLQIMKRIPSETKKKLAGKGFNCQCGLILENLPVPPNCLYVPDICDGKSVFTSDVSVNMLKKVLSKIEHIKRSRDGVPNFEAHEAESNDLQKSITDYMQLRGTKKAPQKRFGFVADTNESLGKQWLEKMKTLFISKGCSFSSRSVLTGDAYQCLNVIGIPAEIAKKITFEERVTDFNMARLQDLVDRRLCLTYQEGATRYAISVGSRGHTNLKVGQIINRQIMDGDTVFINRPPSTHKHSLQAFSVCIHEDHTVKINPLVCAPLGADFDGDCVHLFYPQSLAAKAEVSELFSVENQLLSSHNRYLNLQFVNDSLLALKLAFRMVFMGKEDVQQLSMFVSPVLPQPAVLKAHNSGPFWTVAQILESALPNLVDSLGQTHVIWNNQILKFDFNQDDLPSILSEVITSILIEKGPAEAIRFFNLLQPFLMEILFMDGFSISLEDFNVPKNTMDDFRCNVHDITSLFTQRKMIYNELIDLQVVNHLKAIRHPFVSFVLKLSALGGLIDNRSESSISKIVQQIGFLGLQIFDRGALYSKDLFDDLYSHFVAKYLSCQTEACGFIKSSFFHGLNAFEELVHSISCREIIVRSSRGLSEPGTLFKKSMAILRDVVMCYDGTVRNACSNSIVQFDYDSGDVNDPLGKPPAGEPVGILAATAISNPSYKAVLDSSQATNSTWEMMKEILLSRVLYKNSISDRRVILYMNDCFCGRKFCVENATLAVHNCLRKINLRECTIDFSIEFQKQISVLGNSNVSTGLIGHFHLNKAHLKLLNISTDDILRKCRDAISGFIQKNKKKKKNTISEILKKIVLSVSESCASSQFPCLKASCCDGSTESIYAMANLICPILLDTIVNGDPRIEVANIIWIEPDSNSWVRNSRSTLKGETALEVVVDKSYAKGSGDAWRTILEVCLPVIHLVDTRRSIPYGIQQIEELLGISCAFDQSVQRLSKAVRAVSKGVLKEHLILVVNSITCTGRLIGFITSGFKELFRSLKVQAPFTEATLYTPMKCFQRAAEKCHTDKLASVVSSCSWGKHVALGTGTNFHIMWNEQQVAIDENIGNNVYDILDMAKLVSGESDAYDVCYGTDVDDIVDDNVCVSPEVNATFEDMIFDDNPDVECALWNKESVGHKEVVGSGWDDISSNKAFADSSGWGQSEKHTLSAQQPNTWSSWNSETKEPCSSNAAGEIVKCNTWDDVVSKKFPEQSDNSDSWINRGAGDLEREKPTSAKSNEGDFSSASMVSCSGEVDRSKSWNVSPTMSPLKHNRLNSDCWDNGTPAAVSLLKTWDDASSKKPETDQWATNEGKNDWSQPSKKPEKDQWTTNEGQNGWSQHSDKSIHGKFSNGDNDCGDKGWQSHAWGSDFTDRKNQRSTFPRPEGGGWNSKRNSNTIERHQDYSFTAEEEEIYQVVEPIVSSIKNIIRKSRAGERLSLEDQTFIVDDVLVHHPDIHGKVAGEIDYIMVDKHTNFQDTRCLYVVPVGADPRDFSYLRCMENFVKKKHPQHAESFNQKFFGKRGQRTGGRQQH